MVDRRLSGEQQLHRVRPAMHVDGSEFIPKLAVMFRSNARPTRVLGDVNEVNNTMPPLGILV